MKKILLFIAILHSYFFMAQNAADLDQGFGTNPNFNNDGVKTTAIQSDGKILVGGSFTSYLVQTENRLIRLNADGTKDATFNIGTGFNGSVNSIKIQSDGKILVAGDFTIFNGQIQNRLIRLNIDGTKDSTFDIGSGFNYAVNSIFLQNDGKILVGGNFTSFNNEIQSFLIRLNEDGTKDNSFLTGYIFNNNIYCVTIQTDGKILVGGNFTTFNGQTQNRLIRLNTDGTKDSTFDVGTGFNQYVNTIMPQNDGKILIGGTFYNFNGLSRLGWARLNANGTNDATFSPGSNANYTNAIALQNDGKILISSGSRTLIRLNIDGSVDSYIINFNGIINSININSDGKILTGGKFKFYNNLSSKYNLALLNSDGSIDTNFLGGNGTNTTFGFTDNVKKIALQNDGKILVGGNFTNYNGQVENRLIRLNGNGSKDNSFNTGVGFDSEIETINIQSDGKPIIGGNFTKYQNQNIFKLLRLNVDGSKDDSFNLNIVSFSLLATFKTIVPLNNGKILAGGDFTLSGTSQTRNLVRLNLDGSIDTSFNIGSGFNSTVYSIVAQSDGKILVGGFFTSYNGQTQNRLIRLNEDGSIDSTFNIGSGFNAVVKSILVQNDGKILVGGGFTSYNGQTQNRLIRLNVDGSIDNSFNIGAGFNNEIESTTIFSNNKILVGGLFTSFNGQLQNYLVQLNGDGSKDINFNVGSSFFNYLPNNDSKINDIIVQTDGKILVGGDFFNYQNLPNTSFLVRLKGDSILSSNNFSFENNINLWPNPSKDFINLSIDGENVLEEVALYDFTGKFIKKELNTTSLNISNLSKGIYFVEILHQGKKITKKIVKE